jgi:hypothetical protein
MEAPARVGQAPVRSSSVTSRVSAKPTSQGSSRTRSIVRVSWKYSAKQVGPCVAP